MNMILNRTGYPYGVIRVEDKSEYFKALQKADNGDLELFINVIAKSVKQELHFVVNHVEQTKNTNAIYCKSKNYL